MTRGCAFPNVTLLTEAVVLRTHATICGGCSAATRAALARVTCTGAVALPSLTLPAKRPPSRHAPTSSICQPSPRACLPRWLAQKLQQTKAPPGWHREQTCDLKPDRIDKPDARQTGSHRKSVYTSKIGLIESLWFSRRSETIRKTSDVPSAQLCNQTHGKRAVTGPAPGCHTRGGAGVRKLNAGAVSI
jgi:hypothetical protein